MSDHKPKANPLQIEIPRVALLIETSRAVGRSLLRGIKRYERLHGPWGLHVMPGDLDQAVPLMGLWGGTGIIARMPTAKIADAVLATGLPAVAVDLWQEGFPSTHPLSRIPEVFVNSYEVGKAAAEHLLALGLAHFGFVGEVGSVLWSRRREKGFRDRLKDAFFDCHAYEQPDASQRDWGQEHRRLGNWLGGLPKPVGIFAAMDVRGRQVLDACFEAGIKVPSEVAVIGVDNDELLCELSEPPMSSVALGAEEAGYEAASLLDRMMKSKIRRRQEILIEPCGVVSRRSTEISVSGSLEIAEAKQFIRINAGSPITVGDVVEHVSGISRRSLEVRFREEAGCSLHDAILNAHLDRAKAQLLETDLPLWQIAESCGFASDSYFGKVFRQKFGTTPREFREKHRVDGQGKIV